MVTRQTKTEEQQDKQKQHTTKLRINQGQQTTSPAHEHAPEKTEQDINNTRRQTKPKLMYDDEPKSPERTINNHESTTATCDRKHAPNTKNKPKNSNDTGKQHDQQKTTSGRVCLQVTCDHATWTTKDPRKVYEINQRKECGEKRQRTTKFGNKSTGSMNRGEKDTEDNNNNRDRLKKTENSRKKWATPDEATTSKQQDNTMTITDSYGTDPLQRDTRKPHNRQLQALQRNYRDTQLSKNGYEAETGNKQQWNQTHNSFASAKDNSLDQSKDRNVHGETRHK